MTVSQQLREAIQHRSETHYRIGKEASVDISVIDRFITGERPNITATTIDRLCDYLGLELCPKKRTTRAATKLAKSTRKKPKTAVKKTQRKRAARG